MVPRGGTDCEGRVPHPQPGVPALFNIRLGPAKTEDEETAQALLGPGEIFDGIHGSENFIRRHAAVESSNEAAKSVFAN